MPRKPPLQKLNLATHDQFVTGEPVSFRFMRNTVPAPKLADNQFGQKEEPAGRFMLTLESTFDASKAPGWEEGEVRFNKPLVLAWGLNDQTRYTDPDNWKQSLSAAYGGKKGVALSRALLEDGFDGIVTVRAASGRMPAYVSEIVDLTVIGTPALTPPDIFDWSNPDGAGVSGSHHRETRFGDTTIGYGLSKGKVHISSVRTPTAKRRNGSAKAALAAFLEEADARYLSVTLHASPLDKKTRLGDLVRLYKSFGFELTGRTINPIGDPEMKRPARKQVVMYAPCYDAGNPEALTLSDTGEIGRGLRLHADTWSAASFGSDHQRAIAADVTGLRFRRFDSKDEFLTIRAHEYDLLQARHGEWNETLAAQAEASLVELYRSQGYHGIGWEQEAILFPECLSQVRVLGTQEAIKKREAIGGVVRSCCDSRGRFLGGSREDIREFYAWFNGSAADNLVMHPIPLGALVVSAGGKQACFLMADNAGEGQRIGTRLDGEYYARVRSPIELRIQDVSTPMSWRTFLRTVFQALGSEDDGTLEPPLELTGDFPILHWLTAYPSLKSLGVVSNFDGWQITTADQRKIFLPFDAENQVRPASISYGWQVSNEQEALEYIQKRLSQRKAVLQLPLRLQTKEIWRHVVTQNGEVLEFVPEQLKTADLCRYAVHSSGIAIYFVPEAHRDHALRHAMLSNDRERDMQLVDWMVSKQQSEHLKSMIVRKPQIVQETRSYLSASDQGYLDAIIREVELQTDAACSEPQVRVRL